MAHLSAHVLLEPALWLTSLTVASLGEHSGLSVSAGQRVLGWLPQQCPFNALQFKQGLWAEHTPTLFTWREPMVVHGKQDFWEFDWQKQ